MSRFANKSIARDIIVVSVVVVVVVTVYRYTRLYTYVLSTDRGASRPQNKYDAYIYIYERAWTSDIMFIIQRFRLYIVVIVKNSRRCLDLFDRLLSISVRH